MSSGSSVAIEGPSVAPAVTSVTSRRPRGELALGWAVIIIIALAAPATLVFPGFAKIERSAWWGLVVLISFAGWGGLVERLAFPAHKADLGLRFAWGAAALVGVGGFLCFLSLATRPVLLTLILGGVASSLHAAVRTRHELGAKILAWFRLWSPGALIAFAAIAILAGVYYFGGASGFILNANDDQVAYLVFPQKILATGTLLDPFSVRRITALGGQSFLQALAVMGGPSRLQASLLDISISLVVALALILGAVGEKTPRAMRNLFVLPVLFLITVPNIRLNSASEMSGVVFFLAMFRTATSTGFKERPVTGGATLAMLGAAACTLRQSFLVPVALFMLFLYLPTAITAARAGVGDTRRRLVKEIATAAGALLLLLAPWALLSQRTVHTFLFPIFGGNYRPEYVDFTTQSPFDERVKFLWANICSCKPVHSIPIFLLAGLFIPRRRSNGVLAALLGSCFISFVMLVYSLPMSDQENIARYYYGFEIASVVAIMLVAFSRSWSGSGGVRMRVVLPAILVIGATAVQLQAVRGNIFADLLYFGGGILTGRNHPSRLDETGQDYRRMQATIPAGAPMIVMLDDPYWFDFRRNRIDLIDLPGATSPAPGMPLDDDEKLVLYLRGLGYRYLAFVRPTESKSLYRRDLWNRQRSSSSEIWRRSVPFYMNTFDRFDGLMKSRATLYDNGSMVALDLQTMTSPEKK